MTPPKHEMLLELDGKVFIVDKKHGKEVSREEIDGKVVLQCLLSTLKESIDAYSEKLEQENAKSSVQPSSK